MDKPKYKSVRLLYETYTLLRTEAALRDIPLSELLDIAVKREAAKTGRMLTKAARRGRSRP